jgi:hypothetical protein
MGGKGAVGMRGRWWGVIGDGGITFLIIYPSDHKLQKEHME